MPNFRFTIPRYINFFLDYCLSIYFWTVVFFVVSVRRASTPLAATSVSQVMGRNEGSISSEGGVGVVQSPMSPPLTSSGRFSSSTVMILPESATLSDSEEVEEIEFNNQIGGEGCLPNSSYYEEDTLFTWEDITGDLIMSYMYHNLMQSQKPLSLLMGKGGGECEDRGDCYM